MKSLSGKRARQPPNQPITFGAKVLTKPQSIAKRFNHQFTSVRSHKQSPETRRVITNLRHKHQLNTDFNPFTEAATADAIKQASNSTAAGRDGLTSLHLKHLGPRGISYLTKLYNFSLNNANLPQIWKTAHMIPIPKPGKPHHLSTSYRPISLFSPAVKILARLLLPFINPSTFLLSRTQHGFRLFRSITSALLPLATKTANGFNIKKPPIRTSAVAVDISKALDAVNHTLLLKQVSDSDINSNVVRWLAAYLRGRKASCLYNSSKSPLRIIHSGVPQGSVLSSSLFNLFVSDFPQVASLTESFADDFTVSESSNDLPTITTALCEALGQIESWADSKDLSIAPNKSSITLFTPDPAHGKFHPQVLYKGDVIPLNKYPKILGITWDT
jgi:hypothetical protein